MEEEEEERDEEEMAASMMVAKLIAKGLTRFFLSIYDDNFSANLFLYAILMLIRLFVHLLSLCELHFFGIRNNDFDGPNG